MESHLNNDDAYAVLRIRDYRRFLAARFLLTFGVHMQSVIIGWQVYSLTGDPLSLGLIGLSEVIPFFCISLYAGHAADSFRRKKIIMIAESVYFFCAVALLLISLYLTGFLKNSGPWPIYLVIMATGFARGFLFPAMNAFGTQIVSSELFGNASTWGSIIWHTAAVSGPAVGGLVYGFLGVETAYCVVIAFTAFSFLCFALIRNRPFTKPDGDEGIWQSLTAGVRFVFSHRVLLPAVSLDMFAVLFGGAVAMLPVFASEVFHVGAQGLGILRAAPAAGSIIMSLILAHNPPFRAAGRNLLLAVFSYGLMMIAFALTRNFYLAILILVFSGSFDNVSVIIRGTIIQLYTPDEMRGRVASVNSIFIGSSNELGSFESGVAARFLGLIPSVIFGGAMTLAVVIMVDRLAPGLRRLRL